MPKRVAIYHGQGPHTVAMATPPPPPPPAVHLHKSRVCVSSNGTSTHARCNLSCPEGHHSTTHRPHPSGGLRDIFTFCVKFSSEFQPTFISVMLKRFTFQCKSPTLNAFIHLFHWAHVHHVQITCSLKVLDFFFVCDRGSWFESQQSQKIFST